MSPALLKLIQLGRRQAKTLKVKEMQANFDERDRKAKRFKEKRKARMATHKILTIIVLDKVRGILDAIFFNLKNFNLASHYF